MRIVRTPNIVGAILPVLCMAQAGHAQTAAPAADAAAATLPRADDGRFRARMLDWSTTAPAKGKSLPAAEPVDRLRLSSGFGTRADPIRGGFAMHAGIDIPSAYGTPVYASADGLVDRAGTAGGYGNLVEIDHGDGLATRYGHLSRILVAANMPVVRGQLIGLIGSTGRSTGNHLHYEVRIDGRPTDPLAFLNDSDPRLRRAAALPAAPAISAFAHARAEAKPVDNRLP